MEGGVANDNAERPDELKMWLAVRTDIEMSKGKLAVQAMHAAGWLHLLAFNDFPELMQAYMGQATPKICVKAKNLAALERIEREAVAAGIPCYTVADAGRSEVEPGTKTVCMFGPAYRKDLPKYLRELNMLKDAAPDGDRRGSDEAGA